MESLQDIKHHIRIIREIRHITKAMKMMSVIKAKKAERRIESARPFAQKISEVLVDITDLVGGAYHPLMAQREGRRAAIVVFTSDRGLCGGFNHNIFKAVSDFMSERHIVEDAYLLVIGKAGRDYYKSKEREIYRSYVHLGRSPSFGLAQQVAADVTSLFLSEKIDEAYLAYTRFYSSVEQKPRLFRLLPIVPIGREGREPGPVSVCVFEPSPDSILGHLVPRYVETEIFRALLESDASEQGARLTAMGAATDNADRIIGELTISYNRSRQALITKEISEIVGGAEVLQAGGGFQCKQAE